jgi:hypothetical protein
VSYYLSNLSLQATPDRTIDRRYTAFQRVEFSLLVVLLQQPI